MAQNQQEVIVRGADGKERQLTLLRIRGKTALVCASAHYLEALKNDDWAVGFPLADVRSLSGRQLRRPTDRKIARAGYGLKRKPARE